jgi:hypothetical protein
LVIELAKEKKTVAFNVIPVATKVKLLLDYWYVMILLIDVEGSQGNENRSAQQESGINQVDALVKIF